MELGSVGYYFERAKKSRPKLQHKYWRGSASDTDHENLILVLLNAGEPKGETEYLVPLSTLRFRHRVNSVMDERHQEPDIENDPFLLNYNPSELRIASEFLGIWLPFLSRDLCNH